MTNLKAWITTATDDELVDRLVQIDEQYFDAQMLPWGMSAHKLMSTLNTHRMLIRREQRERRKHDEPGIR